MSARPQARAAGSFPPHSYAELRAQFLEPAQPSAAILSCVATFQGSRNPYFESALTTAVNNWRRDEFLDRDQRLRGSIVGPSFHPEAAAAGGGRDAVGDRAVRRHPRGDKPEPAADHPARVGSLGNGADPDGDGRDV